MRDRRARFGDWINKNATFYCVSFTIEMGMVGKWDFKLGISWNRNSWERRIVSHVQRLIELNKNGNQNSSSSLRDWRRAPDRMDSWISFWITVYSTMNLWFLHFSRIRHELWMGRFETRKVLSHRVFCQKLPGITRPSKSFTSKLSTNLVSIKSSPPHTEIERTAFQHAT